MTKAKKVGKALLKALVAIIVIIGILAGALACVNTLGRDDVYTFIENTTPVEYESQLIPTVDQLGYYTFQAETEGREFKILQLTDIHIGGGIMSVQKDIMALNAVEAMIKAEKPDLVMVTGDVVYPVPFQSGTFNNKTGAVMIADFMEKLGVYWAPMFGNHDTESYSFYTREDIGALYESDEHPHCLFQAGPEDIDGVGNYAINFKDNIGEIVQTLFVLDSHSYLNSDPLGIKWDYDCVKESQVEWYKQALADITAQNAGITPKSLAFFHIPPIEMQQAYYQYRDNGFSDTQDVKYIYGVANEEGEVVYSSKMNYGIVDAFVESNSTKAVFFGHDHVNNICLDYKGVRLTYGYSVDYLAYLGIKDYGAQRGCTVITVDSQGNYTSQLSNYYQDKYQSRIEKEAVTMDLYN